MGNQVGGGLSVLAQSIPFLDVKPDKVNPGDPSGTGATSGEKPCRACTDFKTWAKFQSSQKKGEDGGGGGGGRGAGTQQEGQNSSRSGHGGGDAEDADVEFEKLMAQRAHLQCPLDKDELGRSTWGFLHTMAAYFPEEPSPGQQKEMSVFIKIFAKYYPCEHCAKDFRKSIRESPPETFSRGGFSLWLCKMHNEVNRKLGKSEFNCGRVDERWKDGWKDGSCDF